MANTDASASYLPRKLPAHTMKCLTRSLTPAMAETDYAFAASRSRLVSSMIFCATCEGTSS